MEPRRGKPGTGEALQRQPNQLSTSGYAFGYSTRYLVDGYRWRRMLVPARHHRSEV